MEQKRNQHPSSSLKIGIIGAGFSGTALLAALAKQTSIPLEITLFDKTGEFGLGEAYRTPYAFHLLNVRAEDMSIYADQPNHFVDWLKEHALHITKNNIPIEQQFVSRSLYGNYLRDLLKTLSQENAKVKLTLQTSEITDIKINSDNITAVSSSGNLTSFDKVIFALGNASPSAFPFSVSSDVNCINNPWDYEAPVKIDPKDPVLIVGTGLSMIDTILTLQHQSHEGPIYAVSRRGLLPLPHAEAKVPVALNADQLPKDLRALTTYLRQKSRQHSEMGGDWRAIINGLRPFIPALWGSAEVKDRKRFIRHVLPYWNIHRHRVHPSLAALLQRLQQHKKLQIFAGRVIEINAGKAKIKLRQNENPTHLDVKWVVNCMGPASNIKNQPLIQSMLKQNIASLDPLNIGFAISSNGALLNAAGQISSSLYTLGPPAKGTHWESNAVPEIRKQSFHLAKHLLTTI